MDRSKIAPLIERIMSELVPGGRLNVSWRTHDITAGRGLRESSDLGSEGFRMVRTVEADPGDEIDPDASGETGWKQLLTTQYRSREKLTVRLLLDTSPTLEYTSTGMSKAELLAWLACAILTMAQSSRDKAAVTILSGSHCQQGGRIARITDAAIWDALWQYLSVFSGEAANLAGAVVDHDRRASGLRQALEELPGASRSLVFVLSDFATLTADDVEALAAATLTHAVCCLVLTDPREEALPDTGTGTFPLRDLRGAAQMPVSLSAEGRARWRQEFGEYKAHLNDLLGTVAGCTVFWLSTGADPAEQLAQCLAGEQL